MKEPDDLTVIQIAGSRVTNRVVSHIHEASKNTGVSFGYLMAQANKESSFEAAAGSRASSAAGLFQFTKSTWLQLIKRHGAQHGLEDLANHIQKNGHGDYVVADAKARQQILELRRDPELSSLMAGEYAKDNKAWLEKSLGRPVNSTDLYLAHFLGPGGAVKVLKAKAADPAQPAAQLLPQAAHLNPTVFYESDHTARSVAAVYDRIHRAIEPSMKQYASLEPADEGAIGGPQAAGSVGKAHGGHHHGNHHAVRTAEAQWPFETGQWPPAYAPTAAQSAAEANAVDAAAPSVSTQQVAYTETSQSADQISAPMPPALAAPGLPADGSHTPLGKLLKTLFG